MTRPRHNKETAEGGLEGESLPHTRVGLIHAESWKYLRIPFQAMSGTGLWESSESFTSQES